MVPFLTERPVFEEVDASGHDRTSARKGPLRLTAHARKLPSRPGLASMKGRPRQRPVNAFAGPGSPASFYPAAHDLSPVHRSVALFGKPDRTRRRSQPPTKRSPGDPCRSIAAPLGARPPWGSNPPSDTQRGRSPAPSPQSCDIRPRATRIVSCASNARANPPQYGQRRHRPAGLESRRRRLRHPSSAGKLGWLHAFRHPQLPHRRTQPERQLRRLVRLGRVLAKTVRSKPHDREGFPTL